MKCIWKDLGVENHVKSTVRQLFLGTRLKAVLINMLKYRVDA